MKILIIDDDRDTCDVLQQSLKNEGFVVDAVFEGEKGSLLGRTYEYDIIILDNRMPDKNGYAVCQEIRDAGKTTPIIILSALTDTNEKIELLNIGADDYLCKPFSFQELLARTRALLRRPSPLSQEVLSLDTLVVNTRTQRVQRDEQEIYLTRKEYTLLEYLLRNEGTVLSRGMLLEYVWDMQVDPFSNTIESHILSLRKKLEGPNLPKLIHTIPGRGYKMDITK